MPTAFIKRLLRQPDGLNTTPNNAAVPGDCDILTAFLDDRLLARGCTPRTVGFYRETLTYLIGFSACIHKPLTLLTKQDLQRYIQTTADRGLSPHTVNTRIRGFKALYRWLQSTGQRDDNPAADIYQKPTTKRPPPVVSPAVLDQVRAHFDQGTFLGARNYCLTMILLDTGIRLGELVGLTYDDINLSRQSLRLWETKTHEEGNVPLSDGGAEVLAEYLQSWRLHLPGDRIFCNRLGKPIKANGIGQMFRKTKQLLGITERLHAHRFRHTCATWMVENGASLEAVRKMLRHASLTTTLKYVHVDFDFVADQHRQYGPLTKLRKVVKSTLT